VGLEFTVYDVFTILLLLAVVAVLQFYRGRKVNLILIEYTARRFEEILKPRDKEYQWIGLYVGYKARFETPYRSLRRVEVVLTLLPRQSLFYLPIALLTSRHDRLYLFFRYDRRFSSEAHVVRKYYYRLGLRRVIRGIEGMNVGSTKINGKTFYLVYNDAKLASKLVELVKSLSKPDIVNHIAVVPANSSVFLSARVSPKSFDELILKVYSFARSIA